MSGIEGIEEQKAGATIDTNALIEAFDRFNRTSEAVAQTHERLRERVGQLTAELERKNELLRRNVEANERLTTTLSNLLHSLHIAVLATDQDGGLVLHNKAAQEMFGLTSEQMDGRPLGELLAKLFNAADVSALTSHDRVELRCGYSASSREKRQAKLKATPLRDTRGRAMGRILLIEDVTESELLAKQGERNSRLAGLGEMAVAIVHEIRNPLGSIELLASLLVKDTPIDDPNRALVDEIRSGVAGLNHIAANLLNFARDPSPVIRETDIHEVLEEAMVHLRHIVAAQELEVQKRFDRSCGLLQVDPELLKQALLNILLNAAQAMPEGGRLVVSTRRKELPSDEDGAPRPYCEIKFLDSGCGIDQADRERIFDPFFSTKERGTGLGLALVHKIVRAHGGFVGVDSAKGKGTIMTLYIPFRQERS